MHATQKWSLIIVYNFWEKMDGNSTVFLKFWLPTLCKNKGLYSPVFCRFFDIKRGEEVGWRGNYSACRETKILFNLPCVVSPQVCCHLFSKVWYISVKIVFISCLLKFPSKVTNMQFYETRMLSFSLYTHRDI